LSIRGNWGESFNAPSLVDGAGAPDNQLILISARTLADPYPGGFTPSQATWPMIVRNGAAEGVEPQTATTKQIGADIRLPFMEGSTTVSVTYWNIHFKDIIGFPPANNLLLLWGPYRQFITVNPSQAQVDEVAAGVPGGSDVVGGLFAPGALPVYAIFDARRRNLGQAKLGGLDFSVNYVRPTGFGSFDVDISGSYDLQRDSQALAGATWSDDLVVDTNRARIATKVGFNIGDLRAQTIWYHRHGYDLTPTSANNQQTKADSFNVIDLFFRYDFSGQTGQLRDLSLTLNVNNVLDEDPPIYRGAAANSQFGYVNGFTIGRLIQLGVSKKW
jgi:iron complex outermembrane receptor protein